MNRLQQLQEFLKEDPNDPFTIYAIATEYLQSDIDMARKYYEILLSKHQNYIPTYYHAAKLYESLDERELAIKTYEEGIELATKQNESLALRELKNAYQELLFD